MPGDRFGIINKKTMVNKLTGEHYDKYSFIYSTSTWQGADEFLEGYYDDRNNGIPTYREGDFEAVSSDCFYLEKPFTDEEFIEWCEGKNQASIPQSMILSADKDKVVLSKKRFPNFLTKKGLKKS